MIVDTQKYLQERQIFWAPELCSLIIQSMLAHGRVVIRAIEHRSLHTNGFFDLLDQLCDHWKWDDQCITIETNNEQEYYHRYNLVHVVWDPPNPWDQLIDNDKLRLWNHEKVYGMFIGRASTLRIRGAHNHKNFKYRTLGLTSFHDNMRNYVDQHFLLEYLMDSNQTYQDTISIDPYSDIDDILSPPIMVPKNILGWEEVYEKIGIELVFETTESGRINPCTEKIMRPMFYRRPFMLIAPPHSLKWWTSRPPVNLQPTTGARPEAKDAIEHYLNKRRPIKTFNHFIDPSYDEDSGICRVDHMFDILNTLIRTDKIYRILEDCAEDIEHNYQVAVEDYQLRKAVMDAQGYTK